MWYKDTRREREREHGPSCTSTSTSTSASCCCCRCCCSSTRQAWVGRAAAQRSIHVDYRGPPPVGWLAGGEVSSAPESSRARQSESARQRAAERARVRVRARTATAPPESVESGEWRVPRASQCSAAARITAKRRESRVLHATRLSPLDGLKHSQRNSQRGRGSWRAWRRAAARARLNGGNSSNAAATVFLALPSCLSLPYPLPPAWKLLNFANSAHFARPANLDPAQSLHARRQVLGPGSTPADLFPPPSPFPLPGCANLPKPRPIPAFPSLSCGRCRWPLASTSLPSSAPP